MLVLSSLKCRRSKVLSLHTLMGRWYTLTPKLIELKTATLPEGTLSGKIHLLEGDFNRMCALAQLSSCAALALSLMQIPLCHITWPSLTC